MAYNFFNAYLRIINIIQGDQAHIISISDIEQLMQKEINQTNSCKKLGLKLKQIIPLNCFLIILEENATQILQDQEIPEQAYNATYCHRSVQEVWAYKQINENQQLHTLKTLINITEIFLKIILLIFI